MLAPEIDIGPHAVELATPPSSSRPASTATTARGNLQAPARRAPAVGLPRRPLPARGRRLRAERGARAGTSCRSPSSARTAPRRGLAAAVRRRRLRAALLHPARNDATRPPRCSAAWPCSTSSPTTPTARAATACRRRRPHLGHRQRPVASTPSSSSAPSSGTSPASPSPDDLLADVARSPTACRAVASLLGAFERDGRPGARARWIVERRCCPSTRPAAATPGPSSEPVPRRRSAIDDRADSDRLVRLSTSRARRCVRTGRACALRDRARRRCYRRQLWPAATLAEYRLRCGRRRIGARVLDEDARPLHDRPATEVVAQHHDLASLGPTSPTARGSASSPRRAVRGEDVDTDGWSTSLDLPSRAAVRSPIRPATYTEAARRHRARTGRQSPHLGVVGIRGGRGRDRLDDRCSSRPLSNRGPWPDGRADSMREGERRRAPTLGDARRHGRSLPRRWRARPGRHERGVHDRGRARHQASRRRRGQAWLAR